VVKAGGYGHGAARAARAALAGGALARGRHGGGGARAARRRPVARAHPRHGALSPPELAEAEQARADVVTWNHAFLERVPAGMGST
jgi:hypothetical protein